MRTKRQEKKVVASFIIALSMTAFLIHTNVFSSFILVVSLYALGMALTFGLLGVVADILERKDLEKECNF